MPVVDVYAQWVTESYRAEQGAVMTELDTPIPFPHDGEHPKLRWRLIDLHRTKQRERVEQQRRRFSRR